MLDLSERVHEVSDLHSAWPHKDDVGPEVMDQIARERLLSTPDVSISITEMEASSWQR